MNNPSTQSTLPQRIVFVFVVVFVLACLAVSCNAQTTNVGRLVTTQSLNTNQFSTNASGVNIKSNAFVTNIVSRIGFQSYTSDATTFQAGEDAVATGSGAITVGGTSSASGDWAINIGNNGGASGDLGINVGSFASATGERAVNVGYLGNISGYQSASVGYGSTISGTNAVNLGAFRIITGNRAIGVGMGNTQTISGDDSISLGFGNAISGTNSYVFARGVTETRSNVFVLGRTNQTLYTMPKYNITATNLTINTSASNPYATRAVLTIGVRLISAADGFAQASLYVLQDGVTNIFGTATFSSGAVATNDQQLVGYLQPNAIYYVTNTSSGSASAATIDGTANLIGQ